MPTARRRGSEAKEYDALLMDVWWVRMVEMVVKKVRSWGRVWELLDCRHTRAGW